VNKKHTEIPVISSHATRLNEKGKKFRRQKRKETKGGKKKP